MTGDGDEVNEQSSLAWEHFKETGVILPGEHAEIAARLADAQD